MSFMTFSELVFYGKSSLAKVVPRVYCVVSEEACFSLHRQFFELVFRSVVRQRNLNLIDIVSSSLPSSLGE